MAKPMTQRQQLIALMLLTLLGGALALLATHHSSLATF